MGEGTGIGLWIALAAIPIVLATATAFTKATVVLGAVRVGLSAEVLIPLPAVLALALLVTAVVMGPTAEAVWVTIDARGGVSALQGPDDWLAVAEPLREFLVRHCDQAELGFFAELQGRPEENPLVVVPAFLTTELAEAMMMAVVVLVPFVVVDLLAAQTLVLLGFTQLPTVTVTLPLKILLFLAVGGWDIVLGGLVEGYR